MVVIFLMKQLISHRKKFIPNAIGEEAVVTEHAEISVWDMLDETSDKLFSGEDKVAVSVCYMVKIFKNNLVAIKMF